MLIVDGLGVVRACSKSLAQLLSRAAEELPGRPVWALLPGWLPFYESGVYARLRLAKLHTNVWVHLFCEPLHLDGETWFALDVHAPRGAAGGEAIMVTDRRGEIRHVNPSFEALSGFSGAECAGATPAILKSGLHGPHTYRDLWDTLLGGGIYRGVLINRRKNGELYHEDKAIQPVLDARGRPVLYLSSGRELPAPARPRPARQCAAAAL